MSLINTVQIKNFKSVKDLSFSAKRVNVFVGKPNVGKSNILEALSLFCAGYLKVDKKLFEEFIRLNNIRDLFYKRNSDNEILVSTDIGDAILSSLPFEGLYFVIDPQKAVKNKKVEFSFGLTSLANKERFYDFYDKHQESESYKQSPLFYAIGSIPMRLFFILLRLNGIFLQDLVQSPIRLKTVYFYCPINF